MVGIIIIIRTGTFSSRVKVFFGGVMLGMGLKLSALCATINLGCSVDHCRLLDT